FASAQFTPILPITDLSNLRIETSSSPSLISISLSKTFARFEALSPFFPPLFGSVAAMSDGLSSKSRFTVILLAVIFPSVLTKKSPPASPFKSSPEACTSLNSLQTQLPCCLNLPISQGNPLQHCRHYYH